MAAASLCPRERGIGDPAARHSPVHQKLSELARPVDGGDHVVTGLRNAEVCSLAMHVLPDDPGAIIKETVAIKIAAK
jgi:hypothetical protein